MKILYVITQADGGGAQKYVLALAKHFGGAIAAGNEASQLFDAAHDFQLPTFNLKHLKRSINPWHDLLAVWEIRKLIDFYKPDIVHLNSTKAGILGSFAAIGKKVKVIFTAHGFIFNEPLSKPVWAFYLALEKVASDFRDFIIAVSDNDRQSALKYNLIAPEKITTIHNGIPAIDFLPREEAREELLSSNNATSPHPSPHEGRVPERRERLIFGTIANLYKTKGLDILIEAVSKLDKNYLDKIQFIIIGSGPERQNQEARIMKYGLSGAIKILGQIPDASRYLKAFDAFILPSRKEGLPYTLLEAMQAGLPIVATDVGGIKEALGDAGTIIPPNDPQPLADAISAIIHDCMMVNDNQALKNQGEAASARAKEFTEEKMIRETEEVYRHVLN